jgi:hypothetical protein
MKELIFSEDCYKHPNRDETWDLTDYEIEDKIKELRKEIYKLQKSRKNQPNLIVFRPRTFGGDGQLECHIFSGFQIMNEEKRLLCADSWHHVTESEAKIIKEKFKLTKIGIDVIDRTLKLTDKR